jgi:hypothetical protein
LNWELEEQSSADWDEGARPYLNNFLWQSTPYAGALPKNRKPTEKEVTLALTRQGKPTWTEQDFQDLLYSLGCAGYGYLRPEGVRKKLEEMAVEWNPTPPSLELESPEEPGNSPNNYITPEAEPTNKPFTGKPETSKPKNPPKTSITSSQSKVAIPTPKQIAPPQVAKPIDGINQRSISQLYDFPLSNQDKVRGSYSKVSNVSSSSSHSISLSEKSLKKTAKQSLPRFIFPRHQISIQIFFGVFVFLLVITESFLKLGLTYSLLFSLIISWLLMLLIDRKIK